MKIDKGLMIPATGAAVGTVWVVTSKAYIDSNFGPMPFIGTYIPSPWNYWSTGGSIVIGGILFGLGAFTNIIKKKNATINTFLTTFGITALVGGILNGVFYAPAAGARRAGAGVRLAPRLAQTRAAGVAPITATGIPPARVLA